MINSGIESEVEGRGYIGNFQVVQGPHIRIRQYLCRRIVHVHISTPATRLHS